MITITKLPIIIKTYLGLIFYVNEHEFEVIGIDCDEDTILSFRLIDKSINKIYNNVPFIYTIERANITNIFVDL